MEGVCGLRASSEHVSSDITLEGAGGGVFRV